MKEYQEIMEKKGLPHVGQTVRSKKYGTLWRVMEKREVWENIADDPKTGNLEWFRPSISRTGASRKE